MMIKVPPVVLTLLLLAAPLQAQSPTGSIDIDFRSPIRITADSTDTRVADSTRPRKSLWIAGGLSALLPGAGQIYTEAPLWRTLLYGVIEGAGWTLFAVNSSRGRDATSDFERFADSRWSVERYIGWLDANIDRWAPDQVDAAAARSALSRIYRSHDPAIPIWERVDRQQLNQLERAFGGFSHTLPEHGEQQYYEMIGKYAQFRAGWLDHQPDGDTLVYDPSRTTPDNLHYMEMRATANDYLGMAVTAGGIVMLNHVASMLDAILSARSYNVSISTGLRGALINDQNEDLLLAMRPHLQIQIRF